MQKNHSEVPLHTMVRMASINSIQITNAGGGVGKRERSYTVGGNANWRSHHGKSDGGSPKKPKQSCHVLWVSRVAR